MHMQPRPLVQGGQKNPKKQCSAELTCECISEVSNELRAIFALRSNAGVEVLHGLSKPHPNDKERGNSYFLLNQHAIIQNEREHTNEEANESNPRRQPLHHWFLQHTREFSSHLMAEGNQGKGDEEDD